MYSQEQLRKIYQELAAPFGEESIERTDGSLTRKGYDTVGYRCAYLVDRLNSVLGVGCLRVQPKYSCSELPSQNGRQAFEGVCELIVQIGQWQENDFVVVGEAPGIGSHVSYRRGDALKGAYTNSLKRALSHLGPGWQAFAGAVDDDSVSPDGHSGVRAHDGAGPDFEPEETKARSGHRNGRVTSAQLAKMRELVGELGGDWREYRQHVKEKHGTALEYCDKRTASDLIGNLLASARKRRGNGSGARLS